MKDIGNIAQNIISEDREIIPYRPSLRTIAKTISSTILLTQIMYWDKISRKQGKTKFYKFKAPCDHPAYIEGDSWCEELNISKAEFDAALKNIACKRPPKNRPQNTPEMQEALVWYNTDISRLTWYEINHNVLRKSLKLIYDDSYAGNDQEHRSSRKSEKSIYVNQDSGFSIYTENNYTETNNKKSAKADLNVLDRTLSEDSPPVVQYNGLFCSVCHEPQFSSPGGETCPNGHGGATGITQEDLDREKEDPALKENKIVRPKALKIPTNKDINPLGYSLNALKVIKHWEKKGGKAHKVKCKGSRLVEDMIDELLMEGLNPYIDVLPKSLHDFRMKQWSVDEIKQAIDFYKDVKCKPLSYFSEFVVFKTFRNRKLPNHSPLVESFVEFKPASDQVIKIQKAIKNKLANLYPNNNIHGTTLLNVAKFLNEVKQDYKFTERGVGYFYKFPVYFSSYVQKTVNGDASQLKYISSDNFLGGFLKKSVKNKVLEKKKN